jgi:hypothetical protein
VTPRAARRRLLAGGGALAALAAGAAAGCAFPFPGRAPADARQGAARRPMLVLELIREARTAPGTRPDRVDACRWHVTDSGILYGDHWGWCEDYQLLPPESPGYVLATTLYTGGTSGGYATMAVLPPLPATIEVFGQPLRLAPGAAGGAGVAGGVAIEFRGQRATLTGPAPVPLGEEAARVEAPVDTGHFEPGGAEAVAAAVTYSAVYHGVLDARRVAGRG